MGRYVVVYRSIYFIEDIDYDHSTHSIRDVYNHIVVKTIYYDTILHEYHTIIFVVDESNIRLCEDGEEIDTTPIDYRHYCRVRDLLLEYAKRLMTPWFERR